MFFDTETTGIPIYNRPSSGWFQPHMVRFASVLVDPDTRQEVQAFDFIVRPEGWTIPSDMTAIHGISQEEALKSRWSEADVTAQYLILRQRAQLVVGFNVAFDIRIMRIALLRLGKTREQIEEIEARPSFCVMRAATNEVNIAPTDKMMAAGFRNPKTPKLSECIRHFFGEEHDLAHDAMADVRACVRVYFHILDTKRTAHEEAAAGSVADPHPRIAGL